MRLIELNLKNFQGIKDFKLEANGENISVFGDNAVGKTTIFNSFTYLLFSKDSQNKADFEIKTLDESGKAYHGLEHEVEGVFDIDGKELTLKKIYKELWTKKRGNPQAEFSGHTTDHFISGVPAPKKLFDDTIAGICDEETFKLLTSPTFFNEQLHWEKRRKILLSCCGDISDEDVIASDNKLSKLPEIIGNRSLEDHRKVIAARRTEINKKLGEIPNRIDEVNLGLPDISGLEKAKLEKELAKLQSSKEAKQKEIVRIEAGGEIAEKTKSLREVEAKILDLKNQEREKADDGLSAKRQALQQAKIAVSNLETEIETVSRRITANKAEIDHLEAKADNLRAEWHEVDSLKFNEQRTDICPTCGQTLPQGQLEDARAKFNKDKADKLEAINEHGKSVKMQSDGFVADNAEMEKQIEAKKEALKAYDIETLEEEIAHAEAEPTENPEIVKALDSKAKLEAVIEQLRESTTKMVNDIEEEIANTINFRVKDIEDDLAKFEQRKTGEARIEELKSQEKELAAEYEKLEAELFLCDEFVRAKVSLLDEKINSRFKLARFKMFDIQVNGAVDDRVCDTTYQGVPYSSLNGGARINIGLDIIKTLSEHYGFSAPIFIDNSEAITQIIETPAQQIKLVVSAQDKKLRIETANEKEKVAV